MKDLDRRLRIWKGGSILELADDPDGLELVRIRTGYFDRAAQTEDMEEGCLVDFQDLRELVEAFAALTNPPADPAPQP